MKKQRVVLFLAGLFLSAAFFSCAAKKAALSLEDAKKLLQNHALVLYYADGGIKTYDDKGIIPLFKQLDGGDFKDCIVFDKVTGKASSLVLAYGGARELYTGILSKEAIPVLEKYNIKYGADKIVDYILNVKGDGKCPMEKTVANIEDPQEAYKTLKEKFGEKSKESK